MKIWTQHTFFFFGQCDNTQLGGQIYENKGLRRENGTIVYVIAFFTSTLSIIFIYLDTLLCIIAHTSQVYLYGPVSNTL